MARIQELGSSDKRFSLTKLGEDCQQEPVTIDFSPIGRPNNLFESIVPLFNSDGKYFTPAFSLSSDKNYYTSNSDFEMEKFLERVRKAQENTTNEAPEIANPSSVYCQICRITFDNYETHISSKEHKKLSRTSKANSYIRQLCSKVQKQNDQTKACKTKLIRKQCQPPQEIRKSQRILNKKLKSQWGFINNGHTKSFHNNSTNLGSWSQVKL